MSQERTTASQERTTAAIALGSNIGKREAHLSKAMLGLERSAGVVVLRRSHWIETDPVGGPPDQGAFLNGVALVETTLAPHALLEALQAIESKAGRDRSQEERFGPRTLDLDLLYHGDARVADARLHLPHPRMEDRVFVLEPLAEVAPAHTLPGCGLTVAQRLADLRQASSSGEAP